MNDLNHFDAEGKAIMVDVSEKNITERIAIASGKIFVGEEIFKIIKNGTAKKGDVLGVARVAGIMAAKKTAEMIPLSDCRQKGKNLSIWYKSVGGCFYVP